MQERRRYVRLNIPLELNYIIQGKEPLRHKSITKDVSPGGVSFTIEEQLPKGTVLDINIKIPTRPEPVAIKARIVWSRKESGREVYDAGFEFIHISEESKQEFFQYLCNLMYSQLKNLNI